MIMCTFYIVPKVLSIQNLGENRQKASENGTHASAMGKEADNDI